MTQLTFIEFCTQQMQKNTFLLIAHVTFLKIYNISQGYITHIT